MPGQSALPARARRTPLARGLLLRDSKFVGFLGQSIASESSTNVAYVCLVWLVFFSTGSALDVGLVAFTASVATLVASLPAGAFVDRLNRRWLLFLSHATRGAVVGLLGVLVAVQGLRLEPLVALVLAWSAIGELYRSTNLSILPDLIDSRNLTDAN